MHQKIAGTTRKLFNSHWFLEVDVCDPVDRSHPPDCCPNALLMPHWEENNLFLSEREMMLLTQIYWGEFLFFFFQYMGKRGVALISRSAWEIFIFFLSRISGKSEKLHQILRSAAFWEISSLAQRKEDFDRQIFGQRRLEEKRYWAVYVRFDIREK